MMKDQQRSETRGYREGSSNNFVHNFFGRVPHRLLFADSSQLIVISVGALGD